MMVSTATAVLPVCRSPMISSRWPRPIGTIESIAFRPVCTGCETDFLQITPGATFSMTSLAFAGIGPLPSIGWPSEFTTRPRSSGPTGTSRMRPVHFTVSPSVICSYSPRITAPTESRSRLSARPKVFFGNSSISPCITSERPWMRQMPSVTVTTVPCVRTSAESARLWILPRIRSLISDGLSCCMPGPLELVILRIHSSAFQRGGHVFQPAAHRGVDDFVADGDAHAPDQLLVQGDVGLHPALEAPLEVGDEARELRVVEPESRSDLRLDHAFVRVLQLQELCADLGEQREPVVRDQHAHEIAQLHGQVLRARGHEQVVELLRAEPGIVDPGPHLRVRRELRHGREHSLPLGERARFLGEAEYGLGVGTGVHFAAENFLRAGDGERGDLLAQHFPGAGDLLVDVGPGGGEDALGLGLRGGLRLVEHLEVALFRRADDLADALTRLRELLLRAPAGRLQLPPAALARGQAVGDGLLALFDLAGEIRPDEFGGEPDEKRESECLRDQRQVEVHGCVPVIPGIGLDLPVQPSAPSSGLANAKNMPIPRPMMNEASIRPRSRNTLACSAGIISGWRAAPSRKRLHMIPTPTQAPRAPSPTIRPMPTPV